MSGWNNYYRCVNELVSTYIGDPDNYWTPYIMADDDSAGDGSIEATVDASAAVANVSI